MQEKEEIMADHEITEYERKRLENIKRNDEMLAALKIQSRINDLSTVNKRQRSFVITSVYIHTDVWFLGGFVLIYFRLYVAYGHFNWGCMKNYG